MSKHALQVMLLCPLLAFFVLQNSVTTANRVVEKIFTVDSRRNSFNYSVSIVPPTDSPRRIIRNARGANPHHGYCQPWDSCINRCGNETISPPYSCSCDPLCSRYRDCCIDYELVCRTKFTKEVFSKEEKQICLYDHIFLPTYVIASCPSAYTDDTIRSKCESEISPATSSTGLVYSNSYCATCNGDNGTLYSWTEVEGVLKPPTDSPRVRMCLPTIDKCNTNDTEIPMQQVQALCQQFNGPVLGYNTEKYYKNIYCALCNGEIFERLTCPIWSFSGFDSLSSLRNSINKLYANPRPKIKPFSGRLRHDSIPASFSILLNFGLDGKERMMFSSEDEEAMKRNQERCGKTKIWDPFSNVCRTLYCSTEFILVDFQCIHKSEITDDSSSEENPEQFDIESECTHLMLDIEVSYLAFFEKNLTHYNQFESYLQESLASFFNITPNRIQELNLTYVNPEHEHEQYYDSSTEENLLDDTVVKFQASFDLCEAPNMTLKSEPTVDNIIAMMTSYLSLNSLILDIGNVSSKVSEIRQTMDPMISSWCRNGGTQRDYWNQDFTLILNNASDERSCWIKGAYINKTGKTYKQGEFVANILFQGKRDNEHLVNVSGVVVVCDSNGKLNLSCPRLLLSSDEYNISSNGTLTYAANPKLIIELDDSQYELAANDSVMVCYDADVYKKPYARVTGEYVLNFDSTQAILSLLLSCISIVALAIVFITYLLFPTLRTLPGCNVMNLTGSALAMQITFLVGQRHSVQGISCKLAGMLIHFEILATFFWMNVMAYDLYRTFGTKTMMTRIRDKNLLLWYVLYAYGFPSFLVILAYSLDTWYPELGSQYGFNNNCWITNKKAALLFFAAPLAAILLINSVLYVLTVCAISSMQKIIRAKSEHANRKNDDVLYMRMASVMGFTWALAFFAAWYPQHRLLGQILTYLFIIFNTLQGLFIFFGFVCNKRVMQLYLDKLRGIGIPKLKSCSKCEKHFCYCQPRLISRTVSSETTFSTVSESIPTLISYNSIIEK